MQRKSHGSRGVHGVREGSPSSVKSASRGVLLPICVIGGAFVLIIWLYRRSICKQKASRKSQIKSQCANIPPTETVFVCIPSWADGSLGLTLFELYRKAMCPARVYVGVYDHSGGPANHAAEMNSIRMYEELCEHHGVPCHSENIRVFVADGEMATSPSAARGWIMRTLFRQEKYTLHIHSHTMFEQNWEQACIEDLYATRSLDKSVLTSSPHEFTNESRDDEIMLAKTRMRQTVEDDANPIPPPGRTTLAFARGHPGVVQYSRRANSQVCVQPMPTLFFNSRFAFGLSAAFLGPSGVAFDEKVQLTSADEEDFAYGARLWRRGVNMFLPTRAVVRHSSRDEPGRGNSTSSARCLMFAPEPGKLQAAFGRRDASLKQIHASLRGYMQGNTRSLVEYEAFCGVDVNKQSSFGHAHLGIPATQEDEHILAWFGSFQEFRRQRLNQENSLVK
jgi:hypothetical protein